MEHVLITGKQELAQTAAAIQVQIAYPAVHLIGFAECKAHASMIIKHEHALTDAETQKQNMKHAALKTGIVVTGANA